VNQIKNSVAILPRLRYNGHPVDSAQEHLTSSYKKNLVDSAPEHLTSSYKKKST
jgi:hypothetical protein